MWACVEVLPEGKPGHLRSVLVTCRSWNQLLPLVPCHVITVCLCGFALPLALFGSSGAGIGTCSMFFKWWLDLHAHSLQEINGMRLSF